MTVKLKKIEEGKREGTYKGSISDCYLYYTKLQEPSVFEDGGDPKFEVSILVSHADYRKLKKLFTKNSYKEIDAEDFEDKYQAEPPYEADVYYIVNLRANATYIGGKNQGKELPMSLGIRPKLYLLDDNGKRKQKDDTLEVLVGNGSAGIVSFDSYFGNYKGKKLYSRLANILVTDLVEYEASDSDYDDDDGYDPFEDFEVAEEEDEFDIDDDDDDDDDDEPAPKPKKKKKPVKKRAPVEEDEEEDEDEPTPKPKKKKKPVKKRAPVEDEEEDEDDEDEEPAPKPKKKKKPAKKAPKKIIAPVEDDEDEDDDDFDDDLPF